MKSLKEIYFRLTSSIGGSRPHEGMMWYSVSPLPLHEPGVVKDRDAWIEVLETGKSYTMGPIEEVLEMIKRLNMVTERTGYKFHLFPLIDLNADSLPNLFSYLGNTNPDDVMLATSHEETRRLLATMPEDIRLGNNPHCKGYQIRVDDLASWDYQMNNTTLLVNFLSDQGACHMWADDTLSHGNWKILQNMFTKEFGNK